MIGMEYRTGQSAPQRGGGFEGVLNEFGAHVGTWPRVSNARGQVPICIFYESTLTVLRGYNAKHTIEHDNCRTRHLTWRERMTSNAMSPKRLCVNMFRLPRTVAVPRKISSGHAVPGWAA